MTDRDDASDDDAFTLPDANSLRFDPEAAETFFAEVDGEDLQKRRLINARIAQDNEESQKYAAASRRFAWVWLGFLIVLIVAQFVARVFDKGLHAEEFIAVVVSTSASVFGFWLLVGRYLFARRRPG